MDIASCGNAALVAAGAWLLCYRRGKFVILCTRFQPWRSDSLVSTALSATGKITTPLVMVAGTVQALCHDASFVKRLALRQRGTW